jgi:hypothetical protein
VRHTISIKKNLASYCTHRAALSLNNYFLKESALVWIHKKDDVSLKNNYYFDIDEMKLPYGYSM